MAADIATLLFSTFGGVPDTGADSTPAMQKALKAVSEAGGPAKLVVEPGRYDFYAEAATREMYAITNTASETENPNPVKTIAIFMKGLTDFTLEGGDALFIFHDKMTLFAIDECERLEIRNVRMDFAWPTVTEMTIVEKGSAYMDFEVHADSRYEIREEKLFWVGEGWSFHDGPVQACDTVRNITWRIDNVIELALKAEELQPGKIRLHYAQVPDLAVGIVLQARDGIRDQVGAFIHQSRDIRLERVAVHFMHGLGIVGQFSENITLHEINLSPRKETGRTVAAFADFVHLSGCKGNVSVTKSYFSGAHDDAINVHGTYLKLVGTPSSHEVLVRFIHPQTFGFKAFHSGDEIQFVKPHSLITYGANRVKEAKLVNAREMLLTLDEPVPAEAVLDDVIENITWTPEIEVADNHFARIPTRGVLVSSPRHTVVERNLFERMQMSGILVSADGSSWYESGAVKDLTIQGNRFVECGNEELPVISILPENEEADSDNPVHFGIRIVDNSFEMGNSLIMHAKSTRSLTFNNNEITFKGEAPALEDAIRLTACSDIELERNIVTSGK
ncbi:alpha-1,3-galactosidase-related protein [Paenibacillus radicis (ex Gao et al. 2016)]|uniref:Alpha-1,3-galactosidase A n=1 Tax=Paenibacillus radicis (ex Gao et al. 2016) TaxID=1737354 RepID=A0A917LV72_9BACL|nr:right-handed parallel beta-helix repeat-containing protein [Paenibacillus radicis (ex Gao et al. 2016)]GGG59010.1 alpha-1,3-galactosidase A [Paenibacillus radicis (ex Gao et al. 2016)]